MEFHGKIYAGKQICVRPVTDKEGGLMKEQDMPSLTRRGAQEVDMFEVAIVYKSKSGRIRYKLYQLSKDGKKRVDKIRISDARFNRYLRHNPVKDKNYKWHTRVGRPHTQMIWSNTMNTHVEVGFFCKLFLSDILYVYRCWVISITTILTPQTLKTTNVSRISRF